MPSDESAELRIQIANLQRERRVAEALLQIESLDLGPLLDRICRLAAELMPCERATVYLYSGRARGFVPKADHGTPPHIFQRFAQRFYFGRSRSGTGRDAIPDFEFYIAFNLFRLAAIFHGIKGRVLRGTAANAQAAQRAEAFPALARMARESMEACRKG